MKNYILIFRGCRGEYEDVEVVESELEVEEFCNELYKKRVEEMRKECEGDEEGLESLEEYLSEMGNVSNVYGNVSEGEGKVVMWEVGFSEEEWIEVYEVVSR